jgi:hypothetical protein
MGNALKTASATVNSGTSETGGGEGEAARGHTRRFASALRNVIAVLRHREPKFRATTCAVGSSGRQPVKVKCRYHPRTTSVSHSPALFLPLLPCQTQPPPCRQRALDTPPPWQLGWA